MNQKASREPHQLSIGDLIRQARHARGLTIRQAAAAAGISRTAMLNLEQNRAATPSAATLSSVGEILGLDVADLYAIAGYAAPTSLPNFAPYLRTKYGGLPEAARRELEQSFGHIAEKYGYFPDGPAPGEDEDGSELNNPDHERRDQ